MRKHINRILTTALLLAIAVIFIGTMVQYGRNYAYGFFVSYKDLMPRNATVFDDISARIAKLSENVSSRLFLRNPIRQLNAAFQLATGKKMLFTGDLRRPDVDFPTPLLEAYPDLIVCETAHFDAGLYEPFFKGCGAKKIFFNHYGIQYGRSGVAPIQALAKTLDMPVVIASDGMEAVI